MLPSSDSKQIFVEGADRRSLRDPSLTLAEKEKMGRLQQWYNASFDATDDSERSAVSNRKQNFEKTWRTVEERDFCDLTVEVRHEAVGIVSGADLFVCVSDHFDVQ